MMKQPAKGIWVILIILLVLILDQTLKIWIKTHFYLGEEYKITNWFIIKFVENNGMAMGIEVIGKLFLSIFRIIATFAMAYYIYYLIQKKFNFGYIICIALIFSGAVGNVIDSIFYGVFFSESTSGNIAVLFPTDGGYGTWLHGKVVDMFYFPFFEFVWPSWIPFLGGTHFEFFRYIFNVADAALSVGIIVLLLFYRNVFSKSFEKQEITV